MYELKKIVVDNQALIEQGIKSCLFEFQKDMDSWLLRWERSKVKEVEEGIELAYTDILNFKLRKVPKTAMDKIKKEIIIMKGKEFKTWLKAEGEHYENH